MPTIVGILTCMSGKNNTLSLQCDVECDALKDWKLNIFKIIDRRISFYSHNTNMLLRKPKISYRYLKSGIEEFHSKFVLVPADKAANNVVVV